MIELNDNKDYHHIGFGSDSSNLSCTDEICKFMRSYWYNKMLFSPNLYFTVITIKSDIDEAMFILNFEKYEYDALIDLEIALNRYN